MCGRVGTTGLLRSFSLAEEDSRGLPLLSVGLAERLIGIAGKHLCPPFPPQSYPSRISLTLRMMGNFPSPIYALRTSLTGAGRGSYTTAESSVMD